MRVNYFWKTGIILLKTVTRVDLRTCRILTGSLKNIQVNLHHIINKEYHNPLMHRICKSEKHPPIYSPWDCLFLKWFDRRKTKNRNCSRPYCCTNIKLLPGFAQRSPQRGKTTANKKARHRFAMTGDVGRTGFEPATPWSQTTYSTGLNYLPNSTFLPCG